ncbi:hypothetical protein [Streptomyces jumonjinensis]|uniref:hypothetical protein n=1 Tax=Streptomyces jumonjinensis TaxID=1945 RepID=UPI0037AD802C
MGIKPRYHLIVVLDIERFGSRTDPLQQWLRERLYAIVDEALREAGIDPTDLEAIGDRGDGCFLLIRPTVSKLDLTTRFVDALQASLRGHAQRGNERSALRVRVALHAGDVAQDGRGWVGEALNTACRLVDLDALRTTLAAADRSGLALAVSSDWHSAVVHHDYPELPAAGFREVPFEAKEIRSHAWLYVPGYDEPPGPGAPTAAPRNPAGPARAATGSAPAPARPSGGNHGPFAGAVFHNPQRVYGGDHYEGVTPAEVRPGHDGTSYDGTSYDGTSYDGTSHDGTSDGRTGAGA